jgi:glycine/D-amino acid oxidase-like deaminating enzyme
MLEVYPGLDDVAIDYAWGGTLAITLKRMPHFGRDGPMFWAQGYSGHGVAMANLGGKLIAEALPGRRAIRRVRRRAPPALSRRPLPALAGAGRGYALLRHARSTVRG